MNEEEAINFLKELNNKIKICKETETPYFENKVKILEIYLIERDYKFSEIILNLIEKQLKELEKKDITIIETKEANRQLSIELQKKDKQIEKLKQSKIRQLERYKKYKENIDNQHEKIYEDLVEEIEFKDKIIDLIAETLRYYNGMKQEQCFCIDICGEKECDMKNCKDRIKQYFERKVENGN